MYTEMVRASKAKRLTSLRLQASDHPAHLAYLDQLTADPDDVGTQAESGVSEQAADALRQDLGWIRHVGQGWSARIYPNAYTRHRQLGMGAA